MKKQLIFSLYFIFLTIQSIHAQVIKALPSIEPLPPREAPSIVVTRDETDLESHLGWDFSLAAEARRRELLLRNKDLIIAYHVEFVKQVENENNSDFRETVQTLMMILTGSSIMTTFGSVGYSEYIRRLWQHAYSLSQKLETDFKNYIQGFKLPHHIDIGSHVGTQINNQLPSLFEHVETKLERELTRLEKFVIQNGLYNTAIEKLTRSEEASWNARSRAGQTGSGQFDRDDYRVQGRKHAQDARGSQIMRTGVRNQINWLFKREFSSIIPGLIFETKKTGTLLPASIDNIMIAMSDFPLYGKSELTQSSFRNSVIDELKIYLYSDYMKNIKRKAQAYRFRASRQFNFDYLRQSYERSERFTKRAAITSGGLFAITAILAIYNMRTDQMAQAQITPEMFHNANNPAHFETLLRTASNNNETTQLLTSFLAATVDMVNVLQDSASEVLGDLSEISQDDEEPKITEGKTVCEFLLSPGNPLCNQRLGFI